MRALDLGILISQSLRVEQMQQTVANQVAAQQQAAHLEVERFRVEVASRTEPTEGRDGESEVFNDERQKGRAEDGPQVPRKSRDHKGRPGIGESPGVDRLV